MRMKMIMIMKEKFNKDCKKKVFGDGIMSLELVYSY